MSLLLRCVRVNCAKLVVVFSLGYLPSKKRVGGKRKRERNRDRGEEREKMKKEKQKKNILTSNVNNYALLLSFTSKYPNTQDSEQE